MRCAGSFWMAGVCLLVAACSGDDPVTLDIPTVDTDYAMYGTAPAGRALSPSAVRIVPTSALSSIEPEVIAGTDVDMLFAGLSTDDLPSGLTPESLVLVSSSDDLARPLPTLHDPHVMDVPSPGEAPTPLAPVAGPDVPRARSDERQGRFDILVSDLAIASPCVALDTPLEITTPRLPADVVQAMRTTSDGTTIVAFTTTSTIMLGFVAPGERDLVARAVRTGTVTLTPGENATIRGLGDTEVEHDGVLWPGELAVTYAGTGFGSVAAILVWDAARGHYVERTPPTADTFPRVLYGVKHVTIDGAEHLCTYGGAQGADRRAAIWCRPTNGGEWQVYDFGRSFGITSIVERGGAPLVATDLAGTVWQLAVRGWEPVFETSINANCDPLCASFGATWFAPAGPGRVGILGGTKAQLLYVFDDGGNVRTEAPSSLSDALFAEERFGSDDALRFSAVTVDPSGALWFGTTRPELFRVKSGASDFERICLPPEMLGNPISAIHAHEDGRLFLGMSPALFGYGRWN